jgi:hypothetical protein
LQWEFNPDIIEVFNGRFRLECFTQNWFLSPEDAEENGVSAEIIQWGKTPQRTEEPVL